MTQGTSPATLALATGLVAASIVVTALAIPISARAASDNRGTVVAGMLTCNLVTDTNLVLFSREDYDCTFATAGGDSADYRGEIRKLGADLSYKRDQVLKWAVLAPSSRTGAGSIGGSYVGGSAEATAGLGLGARVLIGGSRSQFTLQPVGLSGQTGLGASATLDSLELIRSPFARQHAEAEERCYPSGLCDGEDHSKPVEDYS